MKSATITTTTYSLQIHDASGLTPLENESTGTNEWVSERLRQFAVLFSLSWWQQYRLCRVTPEIICQTALVQSNIEIVINTKNNKHDDEPISSGQSHCTKHLGKKSDSRQKLRQTSCADGERGISSPKAESWLVVLESVDLMISKLDMSVSVCTWIQRRCINHFFMVG